MASVADSSTRSNLIDITYENLFTLLSLRTPSQTTSPSILTTYLSPRKDTFLSAITSSPPAPFGKPNEAARKAIQAGTVKLPDGVVYKVQDSDKHYVLGIANALSIDEIQALILLRSWLYNGGLPPAPTKDGDNADDIKEIIDAFTPFYNSERSHVYRCLIPLFRALDTGEEDGDPMRVVAEDFFRGWVANEERFAQDLIKAYSAKLSSNIPSSIVSSNFAAKRWAKQNLRESLHLLELLFWTLWSFAPSSPSLVYEVYKTLYHTNFGRDINEEMELYVVDDEGRQIIEDASVLWILVGVEVLELEELTSDPSGFVDLSRARAQRDKWYSDPDTLTKIHQLVIDSHPSSIPHFAPVFLAWSIVITYLSLVPQIHEDYTDFIKYISFSSHSQGSGPREMIASALSAEVGVLELLEGMLTRSPVFVRREAWKKASWVTEANAVGFRSIIKGLVMAVITSTIPESIPSLDSLFEVWIALFGKSEQAAVEGIVTQFWEMDWPFSPPPVSSKKGAPPQTAVLSSRRVLFDFARSRFPIFVRPMLRLLRSMTGAGFPTSSPDQDGESDIEDLQELSEERERSAQLVFHYFHNLDTYTLVLPSSALYGGSGGLFETQGAGGIRNTRDIRLPGGSLLPARSFGRVLSDNEESGGERNVAVMWNHPHSGWAFVMEVLEEFVWRKGRERGVFLGGFRPTNGKGGLSLEEIGAMDNEEIEDIVMDSLDLIRSLISGNPALAEELVSVLDFSSVQDDTGSKLDLVQVVTMVLEDGLGRIGTAARKGSRFGLLGNAATAGTKAGEENHIRLVTSAIGVLTALLDVKSYASRVWLFLRSSSVLFSNGNGTSLFAKTALSVARVTGQYDSLLAVLKLIHTLFLEASSSALLPSPSHTSALTKLTEVKDEVLLRAFRFLHMEIWVEYLGGGWRFREMGGLGDRFEIGRRVAGIYVDVLEHSNPLTVVGEGGRRTFGVLSDAITSAFLIDASTSTINPLIHLIASGRSMLNNLYEARRYGDVRKLIFSLATHIRLVRILLNIKAQSPNAMSTQTSLLEQALCSSIHNSVGGAETFEPVDVLASYIRSRDVGKAVPLEATRLLYTLCSSLSLVVPAHHNIVGHLSQPETTVRQLVRIIENPYEELSLRDAIWNFISLSIDREPALASLFISGKPRNGTGSQTTDDPSKPTTALTVASDILENWDAIWSHNPALLQAVLQYFDVTWQHALEHKAVLTPYREGKTGLQFWDILIKIAGRELGPAPDYETVGYSLLDGEKHSSYHEPVSSHAYRTLAKANAIHILGLDLAMDGNDKAESFKAVEGLVGSEDELTEVCAEAAASAYDPSVHDSLLTLFEERFPGLSLEHLKLRDPLDERDLGDQFVFSLPLLRSRLNAYEQFPIAEEEFEQAEKLLMSVNLNLSLAHSQTQLSESFQYLVRQIANRKRGDAKLRPRLLTIASTISYDIGKETRQGDMMSTIHGTRLALLLAVLEFMWFEPQGKGIDLKQFCEVLQNVQNIVLNEAQPPSASVLRKTTISFHRPLLLIIYFLAHQSVSLAHQPKLLRAEHRLKVTSLLETALNFIADSLAVFFTAAEGRLDLDLDQDMELLVSAFDQCIDPSVSPSSHLWIARCQQNDLFRLSLQLFTKTDLSGLQDPSVFLARKRPLYSLHILLFHMSLARIPLAAERLANDGLIPAYSSNSISSAISAGAIDVTLPELPGDRSPAHNVWTSMLSVSSSVISFVGRQSHYLDATSCAFIQLYHDQIVRALSWTNNDAISFPLLEEIEQVVNLFSAIAESAPRSANPNPAITKVLDIFTEHALVLLQQFNYALTHPNHLATLLEPVTPAERAMTEKESGNTDLTKNSLFVKLVHALYRISGGILSTLATVSRADTVLLGDEDDWPVGEVRVLTHSKVVVGEPASQGTLIELGNAAANMLRDLSNRPPAQSLLPVDAGSFDVLDVRSGIKTAQKCLESVLLYSSTQLAVSLSTPDASNIGTKDAVQEDTEDMLLDAPPSSSVSLSMDRRKGRTSLAERMRRGMPAEVAAEVLALLTKSQSILDKSDAALSKGSSEKKRVDLTAILVRFLSERVALASMNP